jgi:hypothetical protein
MDINTGIFFPEEPEHGNGFQPALPGTAGMRRAAGY